VGKTEPEAVIVTCLCHLHLHRDVGMIDATSDLTVDEMTGATIDDLLAHRAAIPMRDEADAAMTLLHLPLRLVIVNLFHGVMNAGVSDLRRRHPIGEVRGTEDLIQDLILHLRLGAVEGGRAEW